MAQKTCYCIRVKRGAGDIRALASSIGTRVWVGNPVTVWVDSELTLAEIEALPWVDVVVESVEKSRS